MANIGVIFKTRAVTNWIKCYFGGTVNFEQVRQKCDGFSRSQRIFGQSVETPSPWPTMGIYVSVHITRPRRLGYTDTAQSYPMHNAYQRAGSLLSLFLCHLKLVFDRKTTNNTTRLIYTTLMSLYSSNYSHQNTFICFNVYKMHKLCIK